MQHTQSAAAVSFDKDCSIDEFDIGTHSMPSSWVKASMLVRVNQTMRGHSAVRAGVVKTLIKMISVKLRTRLRLLARNQAWHTPEITHEVQSTILGCGIYQNKCYLYRGVFRIWSIHI
jgi:hypothetical protein